MSRSKPRKAPDRNASHKRIRAKARAMALRIAMRALLGLRWTPPRGRRGVIEGVEFRKAYRGGIREARGLLERKAREYGKAARQ